MKNIDFSCGFWYGTYSDKSLHGLKVGSQYNASAVFCFVSSSTIIDGGIDQSSIPPSVTVGDDTKQNVVLALYCEPGLRHYLFLVS